MLLCIPIDIYIYMNTHTYIYSACMCKDNVVLEIWSKRKTENGKKEQKCSEPTNLIF